MILGIITQIVQTGTNMLCYDYKRDGLDTQWSSIYQFIYWINMASSVLNGWGNAILFVSTFSYVNECANSDNKGLFNSILWMFYTGSFITGNIGAAYLIPNFSLLFYNWVCLASLSLTCVYFLFLKNPRPPNTEYRELNAPEEQELSITETWKVFKSE
jgi:hypothetical protein